MENENNKKDMEQESCCQQKDNQSSYTGGKKEEEAVCACKQELEQLKNRMLHVVADFENFKRRTEKERAWWMQSAQTAIITDILAVIDDFERALASFRQTGTESDSSIKGFTMIYDALQKFLAKYEVIEIPATGLFEPEKHEALAQVDDTDQPSGTIVAVLQRGFMMKDRVVRPAKVTVAK